MTWPGRSMGALARQVVATFDVTRRGCARRAGRCAALVARRRVWSVVVLGALLFVLFGLPAERVIVRVWPGAGAAGDEFGAEADAASAATVDEETTAHATSKASCCARSKGGVTATCTCSAAQRAAGNCCCMARRAAKGPGCCKGGGGYGQSDTASRPANDCEEEVPALACPCGFGSTLWVSLWSEPRMLNAVVLISRGGGWDYALPPSATPHPKAIRCPETPPPRGVA